MDYFADLIHEAVSSTQEELSAHPVNTASGRLDEVKATRDLIIKR